MKATKLPSGSWRVRVFDHTEDVLQPDGTIKKKKIYKSFTCDDKSKKGKRICEQMASEWAAQKETNTSKTSALTMTFGEALDEYANAREKVLSPRTISEYRRIRKKSMPELMAMNINSITQDDVQRIINKEALNHSPKTVRNWHGLISAVLGVYRPSFTLRTAIPARVRPDLYVPTETDIKTLIAAIKDTPLELPVLLAAFGPMRRGEIAALRKENIKGTVVHVCENMVIQEDRSWTVKSPKTYAGDRFIDYPQFVADKWKDIKSGHVCQYNPDQITHYFGRTIRKLNMPLFRFHDLRHYAASFLHLYMPDAYIMARGGWESDATLKEVYRHVMDDKSAEYNNLANKHFSALYDTKDDTNQEKSSI